MKSQNSISTANPKLYIKNGLPERALPVSPHYSLSLCEPIIQFLVYLLIHICLPKMKPKNGHCQNALKHAERKANNGKAQKNSLGHCVVTRMASSHGCQKQSAVIWPSRGIPSGTTQNMIFISFFPLQFPFHINKCRSICNSICCKTAQLYL